MQAQILKGTAKPKPKVCSFPENMSLSAPPTALFAQYQQDLLLFLETLLTKSLENFFFYKLLADSIEELCRNQQQASLYQNLLSFFDELFEKEVQLLSVDLPELLIVTQSFWRRLSHALPVISGVFRFFESCYIRKVLKVKSIEAWILDRLAFALKDRPTIRERIVQGVLELIQNERSQQQKFIENNIILDEILRFIQAVTDMYVVDFEKRFLDSTRNFYKKEASELIVSLTLTDYLLYLEKRLQEEECLAKRLLQQNTFVEIMEILDQELINAHLQRLLDVRFSELIAKKELVSLSKLYNFVHRVNKQDFLKQSWGFYIKEQGSSLLSQNKETVFDDLLQYRRDLMLIVRESFAGNKLLKTTIDSSFEVFLNIAPNQIAEITSKQFDKRLHKRTKPGVANEEALKGELDELFEFFRYLTAKDIFEEFYSRRLAKRVLFSNIGSQELEAYVLEKLKNECGSFYTKKAEEIFKDVEISKQINKEYNVLNENKMNHIPFYITILHSNSWPLVNNTIKQLIQPLEGLRNEFLTFYTNKHKGVLLSFQFEGSFCEIYGYFHAEKYMFTVSLLQSMILLLFNQKSVYSFKEMKEIFSLDAEELRKTLYSLYYMKEKLLLKNNEAKTINESDEFRLNEQYQSKQKMIKVNSVQKKETAEEIQNTQEKVLQERQYLIDAAVVRIIKAKKTIGHTELINEVFTTLKLPISVSDTKKRIESLIGRDFLARDKNNTQLYHYIA